MSIRHASLVSLALLSLLAFVPSAALAEPEPEVSDGTPEESTPHDQFDRLIGDEIFGGVDIVYGLVGGALVIAPLRNLALDFGGGVSRDGARVAGGVRLLFPFQDSALVIRMGLAGGPLSWEGDQSGHVVRRWDFTGFVDLSVGFEYRHPEGFYGRIQWGVEHALNPNPDTCSVDGAPRSCGGSCGEAPVRAFVGLALGYMFDVTL